MAKLRFSGELLALSILVLLLGGCAGGKPDIAVATKRHDFGQIKQGDVVSTEIAVRNTGNKELKIESVATSCGCTSAQVKPKIIPSGGEGKLVIRYDSGSHPDKGPIERHIYIASNDPEKAEVDIIITAEVQPPA
ncbi:MAG: DUF1573 domain-containing protein [Deltaproteobacteria bacterium]|nr:DUF1573 domain-containing protein [Deltaproteobacteria bacterium]MDZ4345102.1 DUF1573 domain-containing protein [Candidatus Binatia bacterium]